MTESRCLIPEHKKGREMASVENLPGMPPTAEKAMITPERLKDKDLKKVPIVAEVPEEYIPITAFMQKGTEC